MLDIKFIRENPSKVKEALRNRNVVFDVDYLLELDERRRANIKEVDDLRASQNIFSKEIPKLKGEERQVKIQQSRDLKARLGAMESELHVLEKEFESLLYNIPNIPDLDVPVGKDETDNKVLREDAIPKAQFTFKPRDYMEIATRLDLIDTERASKVSGSRFGYIKRELTLMEFAIIQWIFSRLTDNKWLHERVLASTRKRNVKDGLQLLPSDKPFIPLIPPVMIKPEVFRAMGKLDPGQEEERYFLAKDELYLIGSAEHSTGSLHLNETIPEEDLPERYIAFSTCFRREAGSYGKDTKGILRVHQFDKLEMFSFTHPEESRTEHELFRAIQEGLMEELRLPYRTVLICTGDMVWTDAKQYDIETWLPGQNERRGEYRETHSTSNSTSFQSRRLNAKFRTKHGKTDLVHTVNGTACAIGRMLIAILENYQQEDGSVTVPEVLQGFMGGIKVIKR